MSAAVLMIGIGPAYAEEVRADRPAGGNKLTQMSLEDLLNVEITSVSKKAEPMSGVSAAIFVITAEDIRHSTAKTVPDLLRYVPGLEVASIDGNKWAVTARGGNDRFARRLLVLLDGRTLYSPIYSGVFWDAQDLVFDDIERIEVIRGPGASIWGANAVNGVINIITKNATDTHGLRAMAEYSDREDQIYSVRYGGKTGQSGDFRISMKYRNHPATESDGPHHDGWEAYMIGTRSDWRFSDGSTALMTSDFRGSVSESSQPVLLLIPPYSTTTNADDHVTGAHVMARWDAAADARVRWSAQAYWDRAQRDIANANIRTDLFDLELQSMLSLSKSVTLIAGTGYRYMIDEIQNVEFLTLDPDASQYDIVNAFAQVNWEVFPNGTRFTLGTKLEHNDFTGFEIQPSARVVVPVGDFNFWAAVSRAVRTPTRGEQDGTVGFTVIPPATPPNVSVLPLVLQFEGSDDLDSEVLYAYEAGVRGQCFRNLWIDVAAFYNDYTSTIATVLGTPYTDLLAPIPHVVQPIVANNEGAPEAKGVEVVLDWRPREDVTLRGFYGFLIDNSGVGNSPTLLDPSAPTGQNSPRHQAGINAHVDLFGKVDVDVVSKYVSDLKGLGIKDYIDLDVRLSVNLTDHLRLSVSGLNLIDSPRSEYSRGTLPLNGAPVERTVFLSLAARF